MTQTQRSQHSPQKPLQRPLWQSKGCVLPAITYPDLPVSNRRDEIAAAIKNHQVIIVSGETGSGKTTQLPKICLQMGRGANGIIGHTQPRRIAARAIAERIGKELGGKMGKDPGDIVGYQVRFTDYVGPNTLIKLMTDGILLAQMSTDPLLKEYDTIIVDEAHERSLNIDFILGYLGSLLKKRPDLKVIITSATIDAQRFSTHFEELLGTRVPVIEVAGRTHPVEIRYRPLSPDLNPQETECDQLSVLGYGLGQIVDLDTALCEAVDELLHEPDGDILVFLPGERDIHEAQQTLAQHLGDKYVDNSLSPHAPNGVEIVPLYSRLSATQQHRIYEPHTLRRIVLATNIAETSLTVPHVRYVIDSGLVRMSRFSNKTKVQRLPIERISQASAAQRSGRAGRTSPGIAIRLYSERDHTSQPRFTEPEILRTSLASVILQMSALNLGSIANFPFLDKPSSRAVRDGIQLLSEIGALDCREHITKMGHKLARLPIDPQLGRMLIEANKIGCASEVLVIVAALSIQDVRQRPTEQQEQADFLHNRFANVTSDFITYLNLWRYLGVMSRDLSGNAFRRMCHTEFFHYMRYREWRDIVTQIRQMARPLGIQVRSVSLPSPTAVASQQDTPNPAVTAVLEHGQKASSASSQQIHRAILPGLLSNIGNWDPMKKNYQGMRGTRFTIWPGSTLRRRTPKWVMAAELVETSRLHARTVASIEPNWVETCAKHLLKRSYSEPTWSRSRGNATVKERVTLYGLTLAADRQIPLTTLGDTTIGRQFLGGEMELSAKTLAKEMFISHALVDGDWRDNYHSFVRHNQQVMEEANQLSNRLRDPGVVPDHAARFRFFDARIPPHVTSAASFNHWWKRERQKHPHLLNYSLEKLIPANTARDPNGFPQTWVQGNLELPITYSFTPGCDQDGLTVTVPLQILQMVQNTGFDWLVPGLLEELCVATIRALPKPKRRLLAPATETGKLIAHQLSTQDFWHEGTSTDAPTPKADPNSLEASLDRLRKWSGQDANATFDTTDLSEVPSKDPSPSHLPPDQKEKFVSVFKRAILNTKGVSVDEEDVVCAQRVLPPHLCITFHVVDERGAIIGANQSLTVLQSQFRKQSDKAVQNSIRAALSQAAREQLLDSSTPDRSEHKEGVSLPKMGSNIVADNIVSLPNKPLPTKLEHADTSGVTVKGTPSLVFQGTTREPQAGIRIHANPDEAARQHRNGLTALLLKELQLDVGRVKTRWSGKNALLLAASPYLNTESLIADAQWVAAQTLVDQLLVEKGPVSVRCKETFDDLVLRCRDLFESRVHDVLNDVIRSAQSYAELQNLAAKNSSSSIREVQEAAMEHADSLFKAGFLVSLPAQVRSNMPRYLRADARRIEVAARSSRNVQTDFERDQVLRQIRLAFNEAEERAAVRPFCLETHQKLNEIEYLLEELRVSLFAQMLGTTQRVSPKRLMQRIDGI